MGVQHVLMLHADGGVVLVLSQSEERLNEEEHACVGADGPAHPRHGHAGADASAAGRGKLKRSRGPAE